jgi:hypothetical protein
MLNSQMRKIILIIVAVFYLFSNSNAQDGSVDVRKKVVFGLKVGTNYLNVYDSYGEDFNADPKFGLATGMFLALPIGKYFGIQPELLFSQKGFQATGVLLNDSYYLTRTTSYIDMPLFFALKPAGFLTLLVGPQWSYLVRQNDEFKNATTTVEQQQEFENDNIRRNTLCFVHGLDINIRHIVIGARLGMDILNNNGDGTSTTPRYKNVWFQTTIGYRFYRR